MLTKECRRKITIPRSHVHLEAPEASFETFISTIESSTQAVLILLSVSSRSCSALGIRSGAALAIPGRCM